MFVACNRMDLLDQPFAEKEPSQLADFLYHQSLSDSFRRQFFAVPVIKDAKTDLVLCNTGVIMEYLAEQLEYGALNPRGELQRWKARSLNASIVDAVSEGHDAWHPVAKNQSHDSQKVEAQTHIERYCTRLHRWLNYFEGHLRDNPNNVFSGAEGSSPSFNDRLHLVGSSLTYVDIALFHWLDGLHHQPPCDKVIADEAAYPCLTSFYRYVAELPLIKKHLQTRKEAFTQTGPIF